MKKVRELICLLFLSAVLHSRSKDHVKWELLEFVMCLDGRNEYIGTEEELLVSFVFCVSSSSFRCAIAWEVKPVLRKQMRRLKMEFFQGKRHDRVCDSGDECSLIKFENIYLTKSARKIFISPVVASWIVFPCIYAALCCLSADCNWSLCVGGMWVCVRVYK